MLLRFQGIRLGRGEVALLFQQPFLDLSFGGPQLQKMSDDLGGGGAFHQLFLRKIDGSGDQLVSLPLASAPPGSSGKGQKIARPSSSLPPPLAGFDDTCREVLLGIDRVWAAFEGAHISRYRRKG